MKKYKINISGAPVPKARPRAAKTKTGKPYVYTPRKTKDFEYKVRQRAEEIFERPLQGPISLKINFYLPRPKRLYWKTKPMPAVFHTVVPDADNLAKSVIDAALGVAYLDDGQISRLFIQKMYHAGDEGPKTIIEIEELTENEKQKKISNI